MFRLVNNKEDDMSNIADKIAKLLALASSATHEGEAEAALNRAHALMSAHNLDIATVEAKAGSKKGDAKREKAGRKGNVAYEYQRDLMYTIARVNHCHVSMDWKWVRAGKHGTRMAFTGFTLIGRQANVIGARLMFEYLNQALERLVPVQDNKDRLSKFALSWKVGAAERLASRLERRHEAELRRQSQEAAARWEEAKARGETAGALVVMEDYAQAEKDANEDYRNGWEPGTAQRRREEDAVKSKADVAKWREERKAKDAIEAARRAGLTDKQRAAEDAKKAREEARRQRWWDRRDAKQAARFDVDAYLDGKRVGDQIGLDPQVDAQEVRRIK